MENILQLWTLYFVIIISCQFHIPWAYTPRQYYWWLQRQQRHRYLHGPNVCAVETLPGTGLSFHTECRNWMLPRTICGQRAELTYTCCVGFEQIKGHPGCLAAARLENLMVTLRHVGAEWMAKEALATDFRKKTSRHSAVTLFAPLHNNAHKSRKGVKYDDKDKKNNAETKGGHKGRSIMDYHVLRGRHRLADLDHNALYRPVRGPGTLRVTRYKSGIVAVNCARVLSPNHEATDGLIHVIDRLIPPPEVRTVAELLLAQSELSQFGGLLKKTGLLDRLGRHQPVTVFAPIDKAFNRLSTDAFSHVVRDKALLKALLKYHIIQDSWCSAGITGSHDPLTLEGSTVNMTCGGHEQLRVNEARLIRPDVVAKNGIIHFIDDILFPTKARLLWSLLSTLGLSKLVYFMREVGLNTTLTGNKPLTILAPSNNAFNALPQSVAKRFQDDPTFLRHVLLYHVMSGRHQVAVLTAGRDLNTLEGRRARVHVYPWCTAVESACLTNTDVMGLNSVIHVIDSVILPPEGTVADVIDKHSKFSILRESLQVSGLVTVFQRPGAFTFLAPTDRAFQNMPSSSRDVLLRDPTHIAKILRYHVIGDVHVSCSIRRNLVYPLVTLLGNEVRVRRQGDLLMVEEAIVTERDIMATNGVVHVVDKVLLPDHILH